MEDHSITIKLFENNWITEDQKWEVQRIRHKGECKTYTEEELPMGELAAIYYRHGYSFPRGLRDKFLDWYLDE